ncbi:MAG: DUF86 domain-containing protein [Promethearchaeota archaeon]
MPENHKKSLNKKRIERYIEKLEHFTKIKENLEKWTENLNAESFIKTDLKEQFAIYHAFQVIAEIITDLIAMMIKDLKIKPKDDNSNINYLKEQKFLSENLASRLQKINGLKNVLVYDYNSIDEYRAFKKIKENLQFINEFFEVIKEWLKKNS